MIPETRRDDLPSDVLVGGPGAFVCVVGPSGAGKDTLIARARDRLQTLPVFRFPRRLVTRPVNGWEDHASLSMEAFDYGVAADAFALSWRAHGIGYALERTVQDAVRDGAVVVANISRGSIEDARRRFGRAYVVLVTAPPDIIAARLSLRGRDSAADMHARMERNRIFSGELSPDFVIVNDEEPETGAARLVSFLKEVASTSRAPHGLAEHRHP